MLQVAAPQAARERVMQQQRRLGRRPPAAASGIAQGGQLRRQGALPGWPGPQERQAPQARAWSRSGLRANTMLSATPGAMALASSRLFKPLACGQQGSVGSSRGNRRRRPWPELPGQGRHIDAGVIARQQQQGHQSQCRAPQVKVFA